MIYPIKYISVNKTLIKKKPIKETNENSQNNLSQRKTRHEKFNPKVLKNIYPKVKLKKLNQL